MHHQASVQFDCPPRGNTERIFLLSGQLVCANWISNCSLNPIIINIIKLPIENRLGMSCCYILQLGLLLKSKSQSHKEQNMAIPLLEIPNSLQKYGIKNYIFFVSDSRLFLLHIIILNSPTIPCADNQDASCKVSCVTYIHLCH